MYRAEGERLAHLTLARVSLTVCCGCAGCFGFFEGKFKHLLDSDELEAQVLHCFREIGNALMFLLLLDEVSRV